MKTKDIDELIAMLDYIENHVAHIWSNMSGTVFEIVDVDGKSFVGVTFRDALRNGMKGDAE